MYITVQPSQKFRPFEIWYGFRMVGHYIAMNQSIWDKDILGPFENRTSLFCQHSGDPKTGHVQYLNGRFSLEKGTWKPNHLNTEQKFQVL